MPKIHTIKLTTDERAELDAFTKLKKVAASKLIKAQALLLADQSSDGKAWKDSQIIEAIDMKPATLERLRKRCCEVGPLEALNPKKREAPPRERLLDGEREAKLIAIACSKAPEGRKRWTLRLLADRVVELKIVDSVSHETIRRTLKKTNLNLG